MHKDRRNGDRYYLNLDLQAEGELLLFAGEQIHDVWKLVDISPFGAGLSTDKPVSAGCKVLLQYQREQFEIKVSASVIWCEPENSKEAGGGFRIGLHFNRSNMRMNAELFKALTSEYHLRQATLSAHEACPHIPVRT